MSVSKKFTNDAVVEKLQRKIADQKQELTNQNRAILKYKDHIVSLHKTVDACEAELSQSENERLLLQDDVKGLCDDVQEACDQNAKLINRLGVLKRQNNKNKAKLILIDHVARRKLDDSKEINKAYKHVALH